jgi:transposase
LLSIIYQYHSTRSGEAALQFFVNYRGALHCDGYGGYAPLLQSETITGLNCMVHVRRKFVEALPNGKEKGVSGQVVKMIRALYRIEENLTAQQADSQRIKEVRQQQAAPLIEQIKTYLDEKSKTILPQSPIGKAITYTLKRWRYLINYLNDGRYEIDNNRTERAIKPFVTGQKLAVLK